MKKFFSRKFLLAVAAVAGSLAAGNVLGAVLAAVAYIAAEGAIDAKTAGVVDAVAAAVVPAVTP